MVNVIHFISLSVTAELIGLNSESSAFIYGFMSLLDKLTCGVIVIAVQGGLRIQIALVISKLFC